MSKKTKTSTGYNKMALPYIKSASGAVTSAFNANQPNLDNINSTLQSNMGRVLGSALNNPNLNAAGSYDQDVLSGKYLNPSSNPYMAGILDQTNRTVTDTVNGAIGTRGLAGGSAQTSLLTSKLADADTAALFGQYNTERGYQNTAAGNATSVAGAQDSGIQTLLQYLGTQATLPTVGADDYANQLKSLWGNNTTSTQTQGIGNTLGSVLGAGLSGWASGGFKMASDRRLKTDIEKVREEPDGLGIYHYRYKAGGPVRTGVMADEVAQLRPWALGPTVAGVATVDYGKL